ncbi:unnamed protein product [Agarophyton chilense]|eukprot:gb/GEZJ01000249.1/.p1 GENE.gb/GEZJ01000249.1/~~gb/GEZJ01000249.1/.p1  ORF type:complete len:568 (+),score=68.66 gb/GEZJ01000249.1/:244-1947(+)
MISIAFVIYPAFAWKLGKPSTRCRLYPQYYTRNDTVSLASAEGHKRNVDPDVARRHSPDCHGNQVDTPVSLGLGGGISKEESQYKFFSEHLGIRTNPPKETRLGKPPLKSPTIESNVSLDEIQEKNGSKPESKRRVRVNPADYDMFDQLLQSTGGTGKKPTKGSKPFASVAKGHGNSRKRSKRKSIMSKDKETQMEADAKWLNNNPSEFDDRIAEIYFSERQKSVPMSHERSSEEFCDRVHDHGKRLPSNNTHKDNSNVTPLAVLRERPKRPGYRENTTKDNSTQPLAYLRYPESDKGERVTDNARERSETNGSNTVSYDLMREEFGPGFHHDEKCKNPGDVVEEKGAQNPPVECRNHPERQRQKETVFLDDIASFSISDPPSRLHPPPRRQMSQRAHSDSIVLQERSGASKETSQDGSTMCQDKSISFSMTSKPSALIPPTAQSHGHVRQGTREIVTCPKDAVNTFGNTKDQHAHSFVVEHSDRSISGEEEYLGASMGWDAGLKVEEEELSLLSRPSRPTCSEEKMALGKYDSRGFRGTNPRGKPNRTKVFALENPKIVKAQDVHE